MLALYFCAAMRGKASRDLPAPWQWGRQKLNNANASCKQCFEAHSTPISRSHQSLAKAAADLASQVALDRLPRMCDAGRGEYRVCYDLASTQQAAVGEF